MTLGVRLLEDPAELLRLEPAWRDLWDRTPDATPFQHPDWAIPWWRNLGNGALCIVAAEGDGRLLGLLPLCQSAAARRLVLRPLAFDVSDYAEPLIGADRRRATTAALGKAVADMPGWNACEFVVRERFGFGPGVLESRLRVRTAGLEPAPVLELPEDGRDGLPPRMRQGLRQACRRLRRLGEASFECAAAETVPAILESLFVLHRRRWRERGTDGVLDHPAVQSFHREAAGRLCASGLLRLYRMRIRDRDAAVLYAFAARGTVYYYIGGFEPEFRAVSPGSLIIAHAIEQAIRAGDRRIDFLKGQETYKYRWGASDRSRRRYEITRLDEPAGGGLHRRALAGASSGPP